MKEIGALMIIASLGLTYWGVTFNVNVFAGAAANLGGGFRFASVDLVGWRTVIFVGAAAAFAGGCALCVGGIVLEAIEASLRGVKEATVQASQDVPVQTPAIGE